MRERLGHGRRGLALAYAVATVLVQAAHHHGEPATLDRAAILTADAGPHLAAATPGPAGHSAADCLACQSRTHHHLTAPPPPGEALGIVGLVAEGDPPAPVLRPALVLSCRAPPRA